MRNLADLRAISVALMELPGECRYHGDQLAGHDLLRFDGACCATGQPAFHKRAAMAALLRLIDDASERVA